MSKTRLVPIENLFLNVENPRYVSFQENEAAAISALVNDQSDKLLALADDIAEHGLNPSEALIVTLLLGETDLYRVLEGNRRAAAIKLMAIPNLIETLSIAPSVANRWKAKRVSNADRTLRNVLCTVDTEENARRWIELKHTGENRGVGVVPWDGAATARFRGPNRVERLVQNVSAVLDDDTRKLLPKLPVTTVERLLSNPDFRSAVGVEPDGELSNPENIIPAATVIRDIARKDVKVSDFYKPEDRAAYGRDVAKRAEAGHLTDLATVKKTQASKSPTKEKPSVEPRVIVPELEPIPTGQQLSPAPQFSPAPRPVANPRRTTLIPATWSVNTGYERLDKIFHELRVMSVERYPNACAVLLRVAIDTVAHDYATKILNQKGKSLKDRLSLIADDLASKNLIERNIQNLVKRVCDTHNLASIEGLQLYIHEIRITPGPEDLRSLWDNLEVAIGAACRVLWP